MEFTYAQSTISHLNEVMEIYQGAQAYMAAHGNPQWDKGFPAENDIKGGIFGGIIYEVHSGGNIAAVFSVVNHEGNYDEIEGKWLTDGNYLAVHRLAVAEPFRGSGAAKYILSVAAPELAKLRGRTSIRMDTHEKNGPMLNLLKEQGFSRCGIIYVSRNYTERIAFEKIL